MSVFEKLCFLLKLLQGVDAAFFEPEFAGAYKAS
jgi:hypothetical protein